MIHNEIILCIEAVLYNRLIIIDLRCSQLIV